MAYLVLDTSDLRVDTKWVCFVWVTPTRNQREGDYISGTCISFSTVAFIFSTVYLDLLPKKKKVLYTWTSFYNLTGPF